MKALTDRQLRDCIHPDEFGRFILAIVCVGPGILITVGLFLVVWFGPFFLSDTDDALIALAAKIFWLIVVILFFLLVIWFVTLVLETYHRAYSAEITRAALPELEETIREVCDALSYNRDEISAFLVQDETYGARYRIWYRDILEINSTLAEAVYEYDAPGELKFEIASHVGQATARLLRQYLIARTFQFIAKMPLLNIFVLPWIRSTVYTADQIALAATGDLRSVLDALSARIVGKDLASIVAVIGWIEQHQHLRWSFLSFLLRILSPEPHPVDRIANILCFAAQTNFAQFNDEMRDLPDAHRARVLQILDKSRHARRRFDP